MFNYTIDHIPIRKGKRPGVKTTMTSITIHSTGNPNSTALNERNWLTNPSNDRIASWHICVDDKVAVEAIPLSEVAYHSGTSEGNNTSISIEICESGDRTKTILNAVEITSKLLRERGWGVDKLKRHYDWSGKICPRIMSANDWDGWRGFIQMVDRALRKDQPSPWAKEAWEWAREKGISDGTRPKDTITREEVWTMLYRMRG